MATDTQPGTPVADAGLTPDGGQPDATPDLTEEKTVAGLSRRITTFQEENKTLKAQLAKLAVEGGKGDKSDITKEAEAFKAENSRLKIALKYHDVAPFLQKAFDKGLDPSLVDDEFVAGIRDLQQKSEEEFELTTAHNPLRKGSSQDDQEKNLLRNTPSLF